jgi:hypothetical protein
MKEWQVFENRIEKACEHYVETGELAWWSHPGPKVRFQGKGQARAVGVAPPDYVFILGQGCGSRCGQAGMLEAKATMCKEKLTLSQRMHQHEQLATTRNRTNLDLFGYLVCWYEFDEVRYYPVNEVPLISVFPRKIVLFRQRGVLVPDMQGMGIPDWLTAMLKL